MKKIIAFASLAFLMTASAAVVAFTAAHPRAVMACTNNPNC